MNTSKYKSGEFIKEVKYEVFNEITREETFKWLRDIVIEAGNEITMKSLNMFIHKLPECEQHRIKSEAEDSIRRKAAIFAVKNTNKFYTKMVNNFGLRAFHTNLYLVEDKDFNFIFKAEVHAFEVDTDE